MVFLLHSILDFAKTSKTAVTFDLSRNSISFFLRNTGFFSSIKVAVETFLLFKSISFNYRLFRSLRWTSDSPAMSKTVFYSGVFSISQTGFPHNYWDDVYLQSLVLEFLTWVGFLDWAIVEYRSLCGLLINHSCLKLFLVSTYLGIQTCGSSTLSAPYKFPSRCHSIVPYLKQTMFFWINSKIDLTRGHGMRVGQKCQKSLWFRRKSKLQIILHENYSFQKVYQVLNWRHDRTTKLIHWVTTAFPPKSSLIFSIMISIDKIVPSKTDVFKKNQFLYLRPVIYTPLW